MTHTFRIAGNPGRRLQYVIERLRDGACYQAHTCDWRRPGPGFAGSWCGLVQKEPGGYEARLPELDPAQDYCLQVYDLDVQQVVLVQLIDGHGRLTNQPRVAARKGRPAPRNEYHGGFVAEIRSGRNVELE
jgi:hypothetical protein